MPSLGDTELPTSVVVNGVTYTASHPRFKQRFYWGGPNLILHFSSHALWRMFVRDISFEVAIKAAIAGSRIEYNLYWDRRTNIAAAVYGPKYDPRRHYDKPLVQKVITVFDRSDDRALRAFQALQQLLDTDELRRRTPRGMRFVEPEVMPDIIRLTLDDLGPGRGNSYDPPSRHQIYHYAYNPVEISYGSTHLRHYKFDTAFNPDGYVIDAHVAKRIGLRLDADMKFAESQIDSARSNSVPRRVM